jgi:hypothetical protein
MFLKNYTSDVPVSQTIYRIEQVLIKCGVSGITKEYGPRGEIAAITFHIKLEAGRPPVTIRLPADKEAATKALWLNYADGDRLTDDGKRLAWSSKKKKTYADFIEQGERTAWKLVQDWVEVQLSMIQMKQADFVQVFLPYVWDGSRTFYDALKINGYRGLLPEKTEA